MSPDQNGAARTQVDNRVEAVQRALSSMQESGLNTLLLRLGYTIEQGRTALPQTEELWRSSYTAKISWGRRTYDAKSEEGSFTALTEVAAIALADAHEAAHMYDLMPDGRTEAAGPTGPDGTCGICGDGDEYVYTTTPTPHLSDAQRPYDQWPFDKGGRANNLIWGVESMPLTPTLPYLWRARRRVTWCSNRPTPVTRSWERAVIVDTHVSVRGGTVGPVGEPGELGPPGIAGNIWALQRVEEGRVKHIGSTFFLDEIMADKEAARLNDDRSDSWRAGHWETLRLTLHGVEQ